MKSAKLKIKNNEFVVLLALSAEEQERGLMGAKWPPPNMAFVYQRPKFNSFWMKNTPSPLDIVFCLDGRITKICKGEPFSTSLIDGGLSDLVVEFPYGTCQNYGLVEGSEINLSISPRENDGISDNLLSVFSELLNSKSAT
jgi:uncharacterized protein